MVQTAWMRENDPSDDEIRGEILRLLILQGRNSSICPTDVARGLFGHWREKMPIVRDVIAQMVVDGQIEVIQRGKIVDIETIQGPVRLQLPPKLKPQDESN